MEGRGVLAVLGEDLEDFEVSVVLFYGERSGICGRGGLSGEGSHAMVAGESF